MTSRPLAAPALPDATPAADVLPSPDLLERLSRVYRSALVLDGSARARWASGAVHEFAGTAPRGVKRFDLEARIAVHGQVAAIRSELRARGRVANHALEVESACGRRQRVGVSIWPLAPTQDETAFAVLVRPEVDRPGGNGHAGGAATLGAGAQLALDAAPDPAVAVDPEGWIAWANPAAAELLGLSTEALAQLPAAMLCADTETLSALLDCLCGERALHDVELVLRRADDGELRVRAWSGALQDPEGDGTTTLLYLRDGGAERAELERENAELQHSLDALAHDLRSPLVSLLGFSRLLRQDYGGRLDETGVHFLDRIEQAGRTMESLLHDLLELSRIAPLEQRTPLDPRDVLLQIEAELKPRLEAAGVELELPESPPLLCSDRTRLYQLFCNLIGNAVDHMGPCEDPRVSVEIREEGSAHRVTVRDRGRGIPAVDHERIFEVFQSLGPRPAGERRGTGMGLAIVKRVAEAHGGSVGVESAPGEGAAFHVLLPKSS